MTEKKIALESSMEGQEGDYNQNLHLNWALQLSDHRYKDNSLPNPLAIELELYWLNTYSMKWVTWTDKKVKSQNKMRG